MSLRQWYHKNGPVVIDPVGDLSVKIEEKSDNVRNADGTYDTREVASFKVSRKVLVEASRVLHKMIGLAHFKDYLRNVVDLGEGRMK